MIHIGAVPFHSRIESTSLASFEKKYYCVKKLFLWTEEEFSRFYDETHEHKFSNEIKDKEKYGSRLEKFSFLLLVAIYCELTHPELRSNKIFFYITLSKSIDCERNEA